MRPTRVVTGSGPGSVVNSGKLCDRKQRLSDYTPVPVSGLSRRPPARWGRLAADGRASGVQPVAQLAHRGVDRETATSGLGPLEHLVAERLARNRHPPVEQALVLGRPLVALVHEALAGE